MAGEILIAYDGSEGARAAIDHAGRVLRAGSAVVATVWSPFRETAPAPLRALPVPGPRDAIADIDAATRQHAEDVAAEGVELAAAAGFAAVAQAVSDPPIATSARCSTSRTSSTRR